MERICSSTGTGVYWVCFKHLDHPSSSLELGQGRGVELGPELGEGGQLPELGKVEAKGSGDLLHRLDLGVATDPGHRDTGVDGRTDALIEEVGLQEALAVGDRDDIGRDVGRNVVGLRFDHREAGQGAAAELIGELGAPLEKAAVQVEDVARICLAARRTPQKQARSRDRRPPAWRGRRT